MAKLTGIDPHVAPWFAVSEWMFWAHSTRDGLAHAFPAEDGRAPGWWRRHRHDPQSTPLARVPDLTLPPTTTEPTGTGAQSGPAGPGTPAPCVLVPPPVRYNPRVR